MAAGKIILGVIASAFVLSAPLQAQDVDPGLLEFENQCSVCHGPAGKGNGPLAGVLKAPAADLSLLTKNNNGKFPAGLVYEIIDGSRFLASHGAREMPVWNRRLSDQALFFLGPDATAEQKQAFVKKRIGALVKYIETLQAK